MPKKKTTEKQKINNTTSPEQEKYEQLLSFERYANDVVTATVSSAERPRKYTRKQIRDLLKDPFTNYQQLQLASKYIKSTSGNYFRIINHLSNLLTYDYLLYPTVGVDKIDKTDKIMKSFEDVALYLDKMNLKYYLPLFTQRQVENGEVYLYKLEDSKGIVFKEVPPQYCRICAVEDGCFLYEINFSMFTEDTILDYPLEFQSLYESYINDKSKKSKKDAKKLSTQKQTDYATGWRQISDKGIAFNPHGIYSHGYPLLSFLFDDILNLDDYKDIMKDLTEIENLKLIHQKIPTNEKGEMLFDADQARIFHNATKKNLPQRIAITTNPLELEAITLNTRTSTQFDPIAEARASVYDNAGVDSHLFSGNDTSGEILKRSIMADENLMYPFLTQYANFVNRELKKINSVYRWKVKFLEVTYFNRDDKLVVATTNLASGGSRFIFLALNGLSPLEGINLLKTEQMLNIDDLLVPKKNANTLAKGESGSPTQTNVGDAGSTSREYK